MRIAGGEAAAVDVTTLVKCLAAPHSDMELVRNHLARLRDALSDAEPGVGAEHPDAGPDLDAAVNWWGACLDDLLRH